jgi:hypothetical protein
MADGALNTIFYKKNSIKQKQKLIEGIKSQEKCVPSCRKSCDALSLVKSSIRIPNQSVSRLQDAVKNYKTTLYQVMLLVIVGDVKLMM